MNNRERATEIIKQMIGMQEELNKAIFAKARIKNVNHLHPAKLKPERVRLQVFKDFMERLKH